MLSIDKSLQFEGLDNFLYATKENVTNTILLVDDEINNLQLIKRALSGKYNILTASQGREGLDVLKQKIYTNLPYNFRTQNACYGRH